MQDIPHIDWESAEKVLMLKPGGAMLRHACCRLAAMPIKQAYRRLLRFKVLSMLKEYEKLAVWDCLSFRYMIERKLYNANITAA